MANKQKKNMIDIADVVRWWDSATLAQRRTFLSYVNSKALVDGTTPEYGDSAMTRADYRCMIRGGIWKTT